MPQYYTYELVDSSDNQVFYVGKGSGSRMYQHVRDAQRKGYTKRSVHYKILSIIQTGGSVMYRKTIWESEQMAYDEEKRLIALYGRKDLSTGNLCNLTEGGEGVVATPELNERRAAKHRGMKRSEQARANMRAAQLTIKAEQRQIYGGNVYSAASRAKMSEDRKGKQWSANARNAVRNQPNAVPVLVYRKDSGEFVGEWESISACAKALNCDSSAIWKILAGFSTKTPDGVERPYKSHKGYTFKHK